MPFARFRHNTFMLMSAPPASDPKIIVIEAGFAALAAAVAFGWPCLGSSFFSRIEGSFARLARKQGLAVVAVGLSALLLRLALLPAFPIPLPFIPDDFSFLLAADTFAHGRLTNPTPAMWTHFESLHITMQPTYMSMYFPAQGLLLAGSKVLFGNPWFGILLTSALMCAAICWMLQAWLPPTWALLGGMLAVLRLGLFSYWVNTYTGGSTISALGGALVLGALPRLIKTARFRFALLMAVGIILVAFTRPYEGLLLCLPVAAVLGRWAFFKKNRPTAGVLIRRAVFPLVLIVAAGAWMGYYDYRAFGSPLTLPYTVDRATYAVAPYYIWQSMRPAPVYRHETLRKFYVDFEPLEIAKIHSPYGIVSETVDRAKRGILFFAGIALFPPLIMLRRVLLDRRIRFLVWCVLILMAGMSIEFYMIPHYLAPFTAAIYAIGLQAMRHLRLWRPEGRTFGLAWVRLTVTLCIVMGGLRVFAAPLHLTPAKWPPGEWVGEWYGPGHFGVERAQIEARLEKLPGKQLVIVRYSADHYPFEEWVYNAADIDNSKVVWAREMDAANNLELMRYYKERTAWLVQPDSLPPTISPYQAPEQPTAVSH
jgi:hypothetical protein